MVLMPGFQSTRLATEGALEPFFFLYTDDSIQGNPETCKQSSITLNYEVKNNKGLPGFFFLRDVSAILVFPICPGCEYLKIPGIRVSQSGYQLRCGESGQECRR